MGAFRHRLEPSRFPAGQLQYPAIDKPAGESAGKDDPPKTDLLKAEFRAGSRSSAMACSSGAAADLPFHWRNCLVDGAATVWRKRL